MLRALARRSPLDEELTHVSKALQIILWTLMAASLVLALSVLLAPPEYTSRWLRIFVTIQALSVPTLILNRRGFTGLASMFLVVWLWILVTGLVFTGGGIASLASFFYVIVVFVAGFLLGPRAGIVAALSCIFTSLGLVLIEMTGHLPLTALPYSPIARWITLLLFIVIIMSLQYLAARTIRDALVQTTRELQERKRAEEALEANEALLRQFIKHTPAAIAMFDTKVCYLQASDRWLSDYHQEDQDIIGKSHYEVVPDIPDRWKRVHARALAGAIERSSEDSVLRADGTTEWLQWEVMPWRKGGGEIGGFILFTQDITERKQAEERISLQQMITIDVATANDIPSALEVVLRHVCEKTGWALGQAWIPGHDGKAIECCSTWFEAAAGLESFRTASQETNFSPSTGLPGRVWASRQSVWIRDVTLDTNFPRADVARKSGLKAALGVPILSGDGVIAVLEFFLREPRDEDERLVKVVTAVAAQIGLVVERKQAEEALRWSEEQLRLLLDSTAEGIFGVDIEGLCIFCNASSLRLLGYSRPAELLGKDMHALIAFKKADGSPYPKEDCAVVQSVLNGTRVFTDDEVFWKGDGISFPVECWSYPMHRKDKHIGAVVTFLDITERRRAQQENRKLIHDLGERVKELTALHHAASVLQHERAEISAILREIALLLPAAFQYPEITAARVHLGENEWATPGFSNKLPVLRADFKTADQQAGSIEVVYTQECAPESEGPYLKEERALINTLAEMLRTDYNRRESERALRESEQRFRQLTDNLREVLWLYTPDYTKVLYISPAYETVWGRTRESLDSNPLSFLDSVHANDRLRVEETIRRESDRGFDLEYRVLTTEGSIRWIWARGFPIKDSEGRVYRIAGIAEDITERKEVAEKLKASSEQLRALSVSLRTAKEEEGIRIARELHDELGSALTTLKWSLLRLENVKFSTTGRVGKAAEKIAEMVKLVDSTINTVRRISSELRPGVVDDLGLVSAIEWHAQQFQDNTGVVCRFESSAEDVDLNREQATTVFRIFQEAMTNILRHAQATKANILIEEEEGGFVLEIKDNGRGITETEKLGTRSLGLLGMRERARSVGGTVEISGAAGKGTVLTVHLPTQKTSNFKARAGDIEVTRTTMSSLSRQEKS